MEGFISASSLLPSGPKKDIYYFYLWKYRLVIHKNKFKPCLLKLQDATKDIRRIIDGLNFNNVSHMFLYSSVYFWTLTSELVSKARTVDKYNRKQLSYNKRDFLYDLEVKFLHVYKCLDCNMFFCADELKAYPHDLVHQVNRYLFRYGYSINPVLNYNNESNENNNSEPIKYSLQHSVGSLLKLMKCNATQNNIDDCLNLPVVQISKPSIGNKPQLLTHDQIATYNDINMYNSDDESFDGLGDGIDYPDYDEYENNSADFNSDLDFEENEN